jgi:hypothetical protein
MLLVTFDSNVWLPVVNRVRFPTDSAPSFDRIHRAICSGDVGGRMSETVFTLEAIRRTDRRKFFSQYRANITSSDSVMPDGTIHIRLCLGPDRSAHPGNDHFRSQFLEDALKIGFRLMRCPRVAGVQNPDLKDEWFDSSSLLDASQRANIFGEVSGKIEVCGAGCKWIKEIGMRYAIAGEGWFSGLARAPVSEDDSIAKAVAEWADGDSVAAYVAYSNNFFCTRDDAARAGTNSVFSSSNKAWLGRDYGVKFVSPEELAKQLV